MRQSALAPASAVQPYVGVSSLESAAGPDVITGSAGVTRSMIVVSALSLPTLPAASEALTRRTYVPSACADRS
jgi:hypothetical protein